jgi:hypothetical protein
MAVDAYVWRWNGAGVALEWRWSGAEGYGVLRVEPSK